MTDIERVGSGEDLSILCASALRGGLVSACRMLHRDRGIGATLSFDTTGGVLNRALAGSDNDVFAGTADALEQLGQHGLTHLPVLVGSSRIAIGVRVGEAAPDTSTVEAFKASLLAASCVARGDPAGGGTAGQHIVRVFHALNLTEEMRERSILRVGGYNVMAEVVTGNADFGITQSTEIPTVAGAAIGGWLPDALQLTTVYGIALNVTAVHHETARVLHDFLLTADGRACFEAAGFQ